MRVMGASGRGARGRGGAARRLAAACKCAGAISPTIVSGKKRAARLSRAQKRRNVHNKKLQKRWTARRDGAFYSRFMFPRGARARASHFFRAQKLAEHRVLTAAARLNHGHRPITLPAFTLNAPTCIDVGMLN
jgi:hypothetical protein